MYCSLPLAVFETMCWRKDPNRWEGIWLHIMAYLVCINVVTSMQNHRIIVQGMPHQKIVNLGNSPINIIHHMGTVTLLHISYIQTLCSNITTLYSTWNSLPPTNTASQDFPIYVPPWQGNDLHQGGYGRSWMFTPCAVPSRWAVISRYTDCASRTVGKSSSQSGNILQLDFFISTFFRCTGQTPYMAPNQRIPAASGIAKNTCCRAFGLAPIAGDVPPQMWCNWRKQPFSSLGWGRRQTPNQPEAIWILVETIYQNDGAGQLQCIQQVHESIDGGDSQEESSVDYLGAEPFGTRPRWNPPTGEYSRRFFDNIRKLVAVAYFWYGWMDLLMVVWDVVEEMSNRNSRGEEQWKSREQVTGDGFGSGKGKIGKK